jgi:16S rRNA (cytidine1402-2'-O)-methyltransferase
MGTLYLVSTPIGNLEDITLRALRVLREASLIAAEDTRHTRRLLAHHAIETPCISYHEHNKLARQDELLGALAAGDVALVSDAGTPALSDPGYELVCACIAADIAVTPIPGPSAPLAALVAAGLPTEQFYYLGFLPRRSAERQALFRSLAALPATLVCFESPHRLAAALADALAALGDRPAVVARELTKLHEEFVRLPLSEARAHFAAHHPRGECTLLIGGATPGAAPEMPDAATREEALRARLRELRAAGQRSSAAARTVAREFGQPRSAVYQIWLALDAEEDEGAGDDEEQQRGASSEGSEGTAP